MNLHEQYHTDKLAMTHPTLDSHVALGMLCLTATAPGTSPLCKQSAQVLHQRLSDAILDVQQMTPRMQGAMERIRHFWKHHGQALAVSYDGASISTTRMQGGGQWAPEPGYRLVPANDVGIAIFGPELFRLISAE